MVSNRIAKCVISMKYYQENECNVRKMSFLGYTYNVCNDSLIKIIDKL